MNKNTFSCPDFKSLKSLLTNRPEYAYTLPETISIRLDQRTAPTCFTGRKPLPSAAAAKRLQHDSTSPFRGKKFYRCGICGQYHFSDKEDGRRLNDYNRRQDDFFQE